MPIIPLRVRFSLIVAAIVGTVFGAFFWLAPDLGTHAQAAFWFLSGILLVVLGIDYAASQLVYRRLASMRHTMHQAAGGQLSARVPIDGLDEIGVIARGLNDMLQGLERLNAAVDVRVQAASESFRQQTVAMADSHREMAVWSDKLARAGRLAALGQAAADMAHQIGTPLNLISGYVQLLLESSPDALSLERLTTIQDQIGKVTAVVRGALDSARASAFPHTRVDVGALVRRVCQMADPMLERAGVRAEVFTPEHGVEVLADSVQLELALLNLVSNSVDAMPTGGSLTFRLRRTDDRLCLEVEDTGGGISPDLLPQVFNPWVTSKAPGKGSGLGLSITRQVIARHGGSICADNRAGTGAVFTIDLPAAHDLPVHSDAADAQHSRR